MFRRLPDAVLPFSAFSLSPVSRRRELIWPLLQDECSLRSIAAAAATYGAAMLVPDMYVYSECQKVDAMSSPGAARSTVLAPKLENDASLSLLVVAATERTLLSG